MIPSKEDILNKHDSSRKYIEQTCRPELFAAMDEHAKNIAIGFADWMQRYVLHYYGKDPYRFIARQQPQGGRYKPEEYTIEQLFQSYLQTLQP